MPFTNHSLPEAHNMPAHTNPREHGTQRGYSQHRYRGEEICQPCKAAHSVYTNKASTHRVDTADARTAIAYLHAHLGSYGAVAATTGVNVSTILRVRKAAKCAPDISTALVTRAWFEHAYPGQWDDAA